MNTNSSRPPSPTVKLTASRVATLAPGKYKDPAQESLYLLVRAKRDGTQSRTWLHRIKQAGKDVPIVVGHFPVTGLAEARSIVQVQREQLSNGINPTAGAPRRRRLKAAIGTMSGDSMPTLRPDDKHSIEYLVQHYLTSVIERDHQHPSYVRQMLQVHVLPHWAGRDARTIKKSEIMARTDAIAKGDGKRRPAKAMANRVQAQIQRMFRHGEEYEIIDEAPSPRLKPPGGAEVSRDRALNDFEISALLGCVDDVMRAPRMARAVRILLGTGQRVGELARARWDDIDFEAATWTVPRENSKTGVPNVVPMSEFVLKEFKQLKAGAAPRARFVLPTEDGTAPAGGKLITRAVARNQKSSQKKGIGQFTPHDLRRTTSTHMAALQIDANIVEQVLNHKIPGVAGTYNRYRYAPEKRAALDKWATHLESLQK